CPMRRLRPNACWRHWSKHDGDSVGDSVGWAESSRPTVTDTGRAACGGPRRLGPPYKRHITMKNFAYFRPTTPEQAVSLLENRWGNTELLAGGTDLLDLQKEYVAQPSRIVSIGAIKGLGGIHADAKTIRIGAATKLAEIAGH